jgi:gliding motility-associated-like protein
MVIYDAPCDAAPRPFSPNTDGKNDLCQLMFPEMGQEETNIFIYDIYGHEVRKLKIPMGINAKSIAQWDGKDNNSKPLPQGIYLYVIKTSDEVVCNGTIVIAR